MQIRYLFFTMLLFFLVGGILGYLVVSYGYHALYDQLMSQLGDKLKTIHFRPFSLSSSLMIFTNNVIVSLLAIFLGVTIVLPTLIVFANGVITGLVVGTVVAKGVSLWLAILALVPHGIFELTAFFLSASYGTLLGVNFWKLVFRRENKFMKLLAEMPIYILLILILLFVAALVEVFISPIITAFF